MAVDLRSTSSRMTRGPVPMKAPRLTNGTSRGGRYQVPVKTRGAGVARGALRRRSTGASI